MTPNDMDDSMPGLFRAGPEKVFTTNQEHDEFAIQHGLVDFGPERNRKLDLGAPCPDCVPTPGGWRCVCAGSNPLSGEPLVHLTPIDEAALLNALAYEEHVEAVPADNVNLPHHYARFKIEPIRFICENGLNFFQGNIVKYTLRHDAKNGLEDIDKVIRYATMYRKFLAGDPDWWKSGR